MRMTSHLELNSRAALCRKFAQREPASKAYWLAEANNWLYPSSETGRALPTGKKDAFEQFLDLMATEDETGFS
jgi:hypothetical protein